MTCGPGCVDAWRLSTTVVLAHKATVAGRRAPPPVPVEAQLMPIAIGIGLRALVATSEELAGMDNTLVEEDFDPGDAFLLE